MRIRSNAIASVMLVLCAFGAPAAAELKLPRVSQKGEVSQTVGTCKITITYSRPGVKGRVIWGGLVPYDKVWRTGANEATSIAFTEDVEIDGNPLVAGTYGLHTIPGLTEWTMIFNKAADIWGSYAYDEKLDALRIKVKPQAIPHREWMQFSIPEVGRDSAEVALEWEKVRIPFKVGVAVAERGLAACREAMKDMAVDDSRTPYSAANFAYQYGVAPQEAWQWIEKSIAIKGDFFNWRLKANMLARDGKFADAIAAGEKAIALGAEMPKEEIAIFQKTIADWKAKK